MSDTATIVWICMGFVLFALAYAAGYQLGRTSGWRVGFNEHKEISDPYIATLERLIWKSNE